MPEGEVYVAVESPRGELGCYIVTDGSAKPYRMHIRGPELREPPDPAPHDARRPHRRRAWPSSPASTRSWARSTGRHGALHRRERRARPARSSVATRVPKSALIPLLHLAQEQDGYVTDDAMEHIAELVGVTPGRGARHVLASTRCSSASRSGSYLVNVCTNISCLLIGGDELLEHAEETLGVKAGGTTADGLFTSRTSSASPPAPRRRASRSTTATSTGSPTTSSTAWSTTCGPGGSTTTSRRTARSPGSASTSPADRAAGPAPPDRRRASRCGSPADRRRRRQDAPMTVTDAPKIVTVALRPRRRAHARRATQRPAATRACARALEPRARRGRRRGQDGQPARPRRRRLPRRREVGLLPARRVAALPRGQRRRVRARHLQGPHPHGARSPPAHRGRPHRLLRGRLRAGVPLRPGRDGAGPGAHRRRPSTRPTPPATSARTSSAPTSPSTSSCTGAPAPTSSARRRRSSRASRATGACPA